MNLIWVCRGCLREGEQVKTVGSLTGGDCARCGRRCACDKISAVSGEKHSPGPWKTRTIGKATDIVAADGRYVATVSSRPESADDARLIAAAPEMLKQESELLALLREAHELLRPGDDGESARLNRKLEKLFKPTH